MSLSSQARSNLLVLAAILSTSSLATASRPTEADDTSPEHLTHPLDLPLWSLSPPPARLDRNLEELHYSDKAVPPQAHLKDGSEAADDSDGLSETADQMRIARRDLSERRPDGLPEHDAGSSTPSMTHGHCTSSKWFQPSAPTDTSAPPLIAVPADLDPDDYTLGMDLLHCDWLEMSYITVTGALLFTLMAAGTVLMLRSLWRRAIQMRRRARKESLGLGFVMRDVDAQRRNELEKAGLL